MLSKYGNAHMLSLFAQVWNQLPICSVLDDSVLVIHGGLPRAAEATLSHLESVPRVECDTASKDPAMLLLVDALWGDPQQDAGMSLELRGRGTSCFGPDVTQHFLKHNRLDLVVRSHEVPWNNRGYEVQHNGMLVTIFSAR